MRFLQQSRSASNISKVRKPLEFTTTFGKAHNARTFTLADEKKLLTHKTKNYTDVKADVNAFDSKYQKKPEGKEGQCYYCKGFGHWARDCALRNKQTNK